MSRLACLRHLRALPMSTERREDALDVAQSPKMSLSRAAVASVRLGLRQTMAGRRFASTGPEHRSRALQLLGRGVLAVGAATVLAVGAVAYVNTGFRRTLVFWGNTFPIYAHYRLVERAVKNRPEAEQDAAFNKLHERYADDLLRIILLLRGFYVKIGQIGATRADFVPPQFIERLSTLQVQMSASNARFNCSSELFPWLIRCSHGCGMAYVGHSATRGL
eukprot:m.150485 g.150485  ORF g.150485 m.150485 type:complete len:220 (-) comp10145_c2_seq3:1440-2099(-)